MLIQARERDLGGFTVRRVLPFAKKRSIGPFVFFDHMGPLKIDETHVMDVRPHPHIGLATVTYLFEGHGYHRDTLGSKQLITPGDINWMIAGSGIAHSERTPVDERKPAPGNILHGIQIWVGLPKEKEDMAPSFKHYPKSIIPDLKISEVSKVKLLIGEYGEAVSPVEAISKTIYIDIDSPKNDRLDFSLPYAEVAVYVVNGEVLVKGEKLSAGDMFILGDSRDLTMTTTAGARAVIIGGEPFSEPRHIWWNFVSSRPERIRQAAMDWKEKSSVKSKGKRNLFPSPTNPPFLRES